MSAFDAMADKFHLVDTNSAVPKDDPTRVKLLNWDGRSPDGLVPTR
jgi:nitrate reductase beta subunit